MTSEFVRDNAATAAVFAFFASAWFGWAQEKPPTSCRNALAAGSIVSLLIAVAGGILAWRHWEDGTILVPRPDVNEVDLDPVYLGHELRQRVQSRLDLAPVVVRRPMARQRLQRRQLHALRPIRDEFCGGPARCHDAPAQRSKLLVRDIYLERAGR